MSSTFTTITFYVAPSKERHPLVSQLFRCANAVSDGKPGMVMVTRFEGFLTGTFVLCDGDRYEESWTEDSGLGREGYEEVKKFFDLYRQLCDLGYLSEDHRTSSRSNSGDRSDWGKPVYGRDRWGSVREMGKKKLQHFWKEYPNLMSIIKYGQPYDAPTAALADCGIKVN